MKDEIEYTIAEAYRKEKEEVWKDVYVTDHTPKPKKYLTLNKNEDQDFFNYKKSLQEYNKVKSLPIDKSKEKYERGSFMQKIFDPFAGAERLENGALLYVLKDSELTQLLNDDEKLRAEFDKYKSNSEVISEEDEVEIRAKILESIHEDHPFKLVDFEEVMDKEFSVFKKGEKYSFVKDLKNAYKDYEKKSQAEKILETIPDYVFWDIKTPRDKDENKWMNHHNPFRKYPWSSFFDMRDYDQYMRQRERKENLRDGISLHRRY